MTSDIHRVRADVLTRMILEVEGFTLEDIIADMIPTGDAGMYESDPERPVTMRRTPTFDIMAIEGEHVLAHGVTLIGEISLESARISAGGEISDPRLRIHGHHLPESVCIAAIGLPLRTVVTLPVILDPLGECIITGTSTVEATGSMRRDLVVAIEPAFTTITRRRTS